MVYEKTLRWLEPFGGWGDHSRFMGEPLQYGNDTGLCNRIFHWEIAHYITQKNYLRYTILLQELYWPELELIQLPNTFPVKINRYEFGLHYPKQFNDLKFLTVYDIKNMSISKTEPLDRTKLENMFLNSKFDLPNHVHSDFGYDDLKRLYNIKDNPNLFDHLPIREPFDRPLKKIKIKYSHVEQLIKNFSNEVVGIHIRRNNGVAVSNEDIESVPKNIREEYRAYIAKSNSIHNMYKYIRDDVYFRIIDEILRINPKQKFYISSDLPKNFIQHFYDKYKKNILDNYELVKTINEYLVASNIDVIKLKNFGNVVENLVDLFSLSFSKLLIMSNKSTWSEFAKYYGNIPSINATSDIESIIAEYKKIS